MSAGKLDIVIEKGITYQQTLTWTDINDAPVDLTGYSARLQVRHTVGSNSVLVSVSTTNGGIVLGLATGVITITISSITTGTILFLDAVYDLELTDTSGAITRLIEGAVTITRGVTR